MSVNQVSLMLGPIISAFIFKDNPQIVILVSALLFYLFFYRYVLSHKSRRIKRRSECG